ncbi:MAG: PIN domain-containing protein [Gaiellales bacterium]
MSVFVDTSALYAVLDRDDRNHAAAAETLTALLDGETLVTHGYAVVEATALVQRRLGMEAVRSLADDLLPALELVFVDESLHRAAVASLLACGARDVSLVDWTSFELMRRLAIAEAFAFDDDFARQGFTLLPPPG